MLIDHWFILGVSPIKVSEVQWAIRVSSATGLRTCDITGDDTVEEVYEFWPSDIMRIFRQAGVAIRRPPRWEADCSLDVQSATGMSPQIRSPSGTLTYHLRAHRLEEEEILFDAVTDADVEYLYWFVDDRFVARVDRDESFFWKPKTGDFAVRAVDDLGRSAAGSMKVRLAQ